MHTIRFMTIVLILGILTALSGCGGGSGAGDGTATVTLSVQFPAQEAGLKTIPGSTTSVTIHILNESKTADLVAPMQVLRTSDAQQTVQTTITGIPAGQCWVRALAYDPNHTEAAIAGAEKQEHVSANHTHPMILDLDLLPARISLSPVEISLYVGGIPFGRPIADPNTRQIAATCYDMNDNEIAGDLVWTSSRPDIAAVNQNGLVNAMAPGSDCTITATNPMSGAHASASVLVGTYPN